MFLHKKCSFFAFFFLRPSAEEKKIRPVIDKVFPMKNIRDAHVYLEESHQVGKVILVP